MNMSKPCKDDLENGSLLSIKQINELQNLRDEVRRVSLPKLQRGRVWRPHQIELLWDSLLQEFPIGSFLFTPYIETQGSKDGERSDYHLLDGQQRMNAIVLAFTDPWNLVKQTNNCASSSTSNVHEALWIDLQPLTDDPHGRLFTFRVVTRSHPWGYTRNNSKDRLSGSAIRQAIKAFQAGCKDCNRIEWKPGRIPLSQAWPWDAIAPIPFHFLISAINGIHEEEGERAILDQLMRSITKLPFWDKNREPWKSVYEALFKSSSHVTRIVEATRAILDGEKRILPALVVRPRNQIEEADASKVDPIETLFARFNTGGTQLGAEELIYSILKIEWPEAWDLVEGENGLKSVMGTAIAPARLVMLALRVVIAKTSNESDDNPFPPVLTVNAFRQWMSKSEFKKCIYYDYLENGRMKMLLSKATVLLKWDKTNEFGLPSSLVSDFAHSTPDLLLLLLVWLDRNGDENLGPGGKTHKLLLGTMTALRWFSRDRKHCAEELWKRIKKNGVMWDPGMLFDLTAGPQNPLHPPIPPQELKNVLMQMIEAWTQSDIDKGVSLHTHLANRVPDWYKEHWSDDTDKGKASIAWQHAVHVVFQEGELLIYAQRHVIGKLFSHFDATGFDRLEDYNRPWDFDHILPYKYIAYVQRLHQITKDLVNSIGNLRVWPLELNRCDQEKFPAEKLEQAIEPTQYEMLNSGKGMRDASLIDDTNWIEWQSASPPAAPKPPVQYLSMDQYKMYRHKLADAVISRTVTIYRRWYDDLNIETLFVDKTAS